MYAWDFAALKPYWGLIWQGLGVTLLYTVITVVAGLAIGLLTGILRTMGPRWVSIPVRGYIELFRGTPVLLQLFILYYGIAPIVHLSAPAAAIRLPSCTVIVSSLCRPFSTGLSPAVLCR